MARIVYIVLFILVAAVPFALFAALQSQGSGSSSGYARSSYGMRSSFFFVDLDGDRYQRGRSYSSGGYQGGGLRAGK